MMVPTNPQNSISVCQSRPLRARREASIASTAPTRPSQIVANRRSKPGRAIPPPERPRSSSMTSTVVQPSCLAAIGEPVLAAPALMIVCQLIGRRLTDVDTGAACKMLSRDLGHDCSPPLQAPLRSRATGLHQWRQIGLLLGRQVDAWCVLLEKARLEIFGSARHYRLPPFLIRKGESLKAHRPRCAGTAKYQGKNAACR